MKKNPQFFYSVTWFEVAVAAGEKHSINHNTHTCRPAFCLVLCNRLILLQSYRPQLLLPAVRSD